MARIERNGTLVQEGNTLSAGSIFFGGLNGASGDMCFYGNSQNDNAVPAGYWKFFLTTPGNDQLVCTYNIAANGGSATITAGAIGSSQTICSGQTPSPLTSVTAATGFTSYKWQSSTTSALSGFTDIPSATSATYSPGPLSQTTYFQRIAISGDIQSATGVVTVTVSSNVQWTGGTNTSFGNTANWNPAIIPSTGCNVTIPGSLSTYPTLGSATNISGLTMNAGSQLNLSSNNLTVTGNFINNGTINGTADLVFAGSSAQTISGNGIVRNATVNNSNGIIIPSGDANKMNMAGVLTLTAGTVTTNSNLVFKSSATQNGMIGIVSGCNRDPFIGDVVVERFIPAGRRSFRFLTPGLKSTTSINANWQEGATVTDPLGYPNASGIYNPAPGYGIHITGSRTGQNGLDATITGNPSMYTYDNAANPQQWLSITNTLTKNFEIGQGYQVMVRGSRATDLRTNTPSIENTLIRVTGHPAVCRFEFNTASDATYTVPLSNLPSGYSLIGNPFWSVVDFRLVTTTGVEDNIFYWDPTLQGSNQRGAYTSYNKSSQTASIVGGGGGSTNVNHFLQPGQAFFVRNTFGAGIRQVVFEEVDKPSEQQGNKKEIFGAQPIGTGEVLGVEGENPSSDEDPIIERMYVALNTQGSAGLKPADGFAIVYNPDFVDGYSREDAPKFSNLDENMVAQFGNTNYSILGLRSSDEYKSDTINLHFTNLLNKTYLVSFDMTNSIDPRREVYLLDRTSGKKTILPLGSKYEYMFIQPLDQRTKNDLSIVFNSMKLPLLTRSRKQLVAFPNPSNGIVRFVLPETAGVVDLRKTSVQVLNTAGLVVLSQDAALDQDGIGSLDVGKLNTGIYIVKVTIGNKTFVTNIIRQ